MSASLVYLLIPTLAIFAWGVWIYNRLVRDQNHVKAGWSDIGVQLKRRHDLIPNLVAAVEAYARYERATLTSVTQLRTQSDTLSSPRELASVERHLGDGVVRLLAIAESYPDLKADKNFLDLQRAISDVEDALQYARRFYNGAVREYNTRVRSFPDAMIATPMGLRESEYFEDKASS